MHRPLIAITMGDPAGVGSELIVRALQNNAIYTQCRPLVIGDITVLTKAAGITGIPTAFNDVATPESGRYTPGQIDVLCRSALADTHAWASPTPETSAAMLDYIETAVALANRKTVHGVVTSPIHKVAFKLAGAPFPGHTELLAARTGGHRPIMMLTGDRLSVVLVTIHMGLDQVAAHLTPDRILETIRITAQDLNTRFGIADPHLAVAGFNPHAGEDGLFGDEEARVIEPAMQAARDKGIRVSGPFPPDTLFVHAVDGPYDAVVCMYHDQGLIPFKLIHFADGVNTTLGLPIIRTSVDHGTAYDIAGTGTAQPGSLIKALSLAARQAGHAMAAA